MMNSEGRAGGQTASSLPGAVQTGPFRLRVLRRLSLGTAVNVPVAVLLLAAFGISLYQSAKVVYRNKSRDAAAIAFLELETRGARLARALRDASERNTPDLAAMSFRLEGEQLVPTKGELQRPIPLRLLGLTELAFEDPVTVLRLGGRSYFAKVVKQPGAAAAGAAAAGAAAAGARHPTQAMLYLWVMSPAKVLPWPGRTAQAKAYLVSRQGKLIFSSSPEISEANAETRPLVQRFIAAPFTVSQMILGNSMLEPVLGLYHEVPGTNLTLFCEEPLGFVFASAKAVALDLVAPLVFLLASGLLLLQVPLMVTTKALREYTLLAVALAEDQAHAPAQVSGFGEVAHLGAALVRMGTALAVVKAPQPMVAGLADGSLPGMPDPHTALATEFLATASHDADWHALHYDAESGCLVLAAAGVVARGVGPTEVRGLLAGVFADVVGSPPPDLAVAGPMLERLNRGLLALGGGRWQVNAQVIEMAKDGRVTVTTAGYPGSAMPSLETVEKLAGPSGPLGLGPELRTATSTLMMPASPRGAAS